MAKEFTTENFDTELQTDIPVMADFWAPWCGPCRMIGPFVEQIAEEYEGKAAVGKINVDEQTELAARFGVSTIPTILVFKNGEIIERAVGARTKAALAEMIQRHL